jgi:penicillin-binding protein 2
VNMNGLSDRTWTVSALRAADHSASPQDRRIMLMVAIVVALAFGALLARLWYIQVLQGQSFRELSENNRIRLTDLPPSRGLIFDAKGRLLADNRPAFTLAIVPEDVSDWPRLMDRLQRLVGITPGEIKKARAAAKGLPPFKPIRIRSHLDREELALLETFRYELTGVKVFVEYRRAYLAARETAHLIGYLGEINKQELQKAPDKLYRLGDYVGRYGLESSRERILHGRRGARQIEVDAMGRELALLNQAPPVPGHNLILSIDLELQKAAALAMGDRVGAVVALNPKNGQIYCMYSSPTFDQNEFISGMTGEQWTSLRNDHRHPLKDRAISGLYPPGSTYKVVTAAAALSEGVVTPATSYFCGGQMKFGRRTYKCWAYKKGGHGNVSLYEALRGSCDIYFYRVGLKLGVDRLAKYARAFGLGRQTGVPLPHESAGLVPTAAWKKRRFGEPWQEGETLSIAIGQGFNLTTPLQLARMVAVVANGGRLVTPNLVKAMVPAGSGQEVPEPEGVISKVPVKQAHLRMIHEGMVGVVNDPRGTARRAKVKGIKVAGKTGTSQVVSLKFERSFGKKENVPWKYRSHALFVAYAPAENPRVAMAVVLEHGGSGGSDAAPVAQKVLDAFFSGQREKMADSGQAQRRVN